MSQSRILVLPAVSSTDCIRALGIFGYSRIEQREETMLLAGGDRIVSVPMVPILEAETLGHILRSAGVGTDDFLDVLSSLSIRRIYVGNLRMGTSSVPDGS